MGSKLQTVVKNQGPDMKDAQLAAQALWDDFRLHFRATVAFRENSVLWRAYAHDGCTLTESDRSYQTYKKYDLSRPGNTAQTLHALACDLYWQAQRDEIWEHPEKALEAPND